MQNSAWARAVTPILPQVGIADQALMPRCGDGPRIVERIRPLGLRRGLGHQLLRRAERRIERLGFLRIAAELAGIRLGQQLLRGEGGRGKQRGREGQSIGPKSAERFSDKSDAIKERDIGPKSAERFSDKSDAMRKL